MPKMKTNRSAAKRFKVTGSGRLRRRKAGKSHLQEEKRAKRKRHLRRPSLVGREEMERMKRLLPYAL